MKMKYMCVRVLTQLNATSNTYIICHSNGYALILTIEFYLVAELRLKRNFVELIKM